jgi:predicted enzyme related to lactoylglutathione lyase
LTDPDQKPSARGVMIYLNVDRRLDETIGAVPALGGKVIEPKHEIAPFGFRSFSTAKAIASRSIPSSCRF